MCIFIYIICRIKLLLIMPKAFTDGEIEHLISLFRNEPCLWNSNEVSYSNRDDRSAALRRIRDEMLLLMPDRVLDIGKLVNIVHVDRHVVCYNMVSCGVE